MGGVHSEFNKFVEVPAAVKYALQYATEDVKNMERLRAETHRQLNRSFLSYVNAQAAANPKAFHHLYETNGIGQSAKRLFDLNQMKSGTAKTQIAFQIGFRPSKSRVPLTEAQQTPGPSGLVVKKRYIFINKAMTMEYGLPVRIRPRGKGFMAIDDPTKKSGLRFTRKQVNVARAGGPLVHGSMRRATKDYFKSYGSKKVSDITTTYLTNVGQRAAARMGRSGKITIGVPNFAQARAVGKAIAAEVNP